MAAAARMSGLALPSFMGGVTMMSSSTPAILAGIAFISTEEGYAAVPPGTYSPTRCSPRMRWPRMTPFSLGFTKLWCFCRLWKSAMFSWAFSRAETKSGSALVSASLISSRVTSRAGGSFPSNFRVYSSHGLVAVLPDVFQDFRNGCGDLCGPPPRCGSAGRLKQRLLARTSVGQLRLAALFHSFLHFTAVPESGGNQNLRSPFSAASGWRC